MAQRLIAPAFGLLLLILFHATGFDTVLANNSLDLLFRLRGPRQPDQRIVIIGVDEPSLQRLGAWPFPRRLHAQLLGRLGQASVVGFDFLFPEPAAEDDILSTAMAKGPPVVLAMARELSGNLLQPAPTLSGYHGVGHIETMLSGDGIVRRFQPRQEHALPAFSEALLQASGIKARSHLANTAPILNYYGPEDTFLSLSYAEILAGRYAVEFFSGRIVLVGAKAIGLHDSYVTSFTRERPTPGVEIQATILANLLERSFIRALPAATFLVAALICLLAVAVWPAMGERAKLLLNLTLALCIVLAAMLLFRHCFFFDFLPALLVLLFAYMAHLIQQLITAASRILSQARQLSLEVDTGLRQVYTNIPEQFIQATTTNNPLSTSGIQRHLDRLQTVLNALNLQHHFLENLLKEELPPLILWERHGGTTIFANTHFLEFWKRYNPDGDEMLPRYDAFMAAVRKHPPGEGDATRADLLDHDEFDGYLDVEVREESGAKRYLQISRHPLDAWETDFSGTLAVFQDVTEIKELERVKDEVVSIVSHELKLPLTTLLGYGEILSDSLTGDHHHYAQQICDQVKRLNRMIEDFLDIARLESGRRTLRRFPFPLGRMLEDAVGTVTVRGRQKEIEIVLRHPGKTTPMLGDEPLLLQAVINLLDNAVKFSPPRTTVSISLEEEEARFVLLVADQGPGIPEEERDAVFEKFQRGSITKDQEGFGLGLHLVRQIITGHRGEIEAIDSAVGATFRVILPKEVAINGQDSLTGP